MQSLSNKRLIINCTINNKTAPFLVDTGASVGLIDENSKKKYNLKVGKKFNKSLIGAGGEISSSYLCDSLIELNGKQINQFIFSDISQIQNSIEHETGIKIIGIIGLPQMKFIGMKIDMINNTVTV